MKYSKQDAKAYSRAHFKGVWAAMLTVFDDKLRVDETACKANLHHWVHDLQLSGLFVSGKQAEYFSMSIAERKRQIEMAVEVASQSKTGCGVIASCSDTNLDVVLDLAKYSHAVGADYIVVHSPVLHFGADTEDTIFEYYRYISEQVDIGIALWNHPDCGYEMSPELCSRIADLPNIVAIKYSVARPKYAELTRIAGHKILVSNPSEEFWFENMTELGWQLYLCSSPPYLLQTKVDQRMNEYTKLVLAGSIDQARAVRDSMEPIRKAFKESRPDGKPQAHSKYWQELLGQHGGPVRRPLLQMTDNEKAVTRDAFAVSAIRVR
jgi:4-hydroxy-tetrahydrodipicolinate synthase